jgi:hypothetical protein
MAEAARALDDALAAIQSAEERSLVLEMLEDLDLATEGTSPAVALLAAFAAHLYVGPPSDEGPRRALCSLVLLGGVADARARGGLLEGAAALLRAASLEPHPCVLQALGVALCPPGERAPELRAVCEAAAQRPSPRAALALWMLHDLLSGAAQRRQVAEAALPALLAMALGGDGDARTAAALLLAEWEHGGQLPPQALLLAQPPPPSPPPPGGEGAAAAAAAEQQPQAKLALQRLVGERGGVSKLLHVLRGPGPPWRPALEALSGIAAVWPAAISTRAAGVAAAQLLEATRPGRPACAATACPALAILDAHCQAVAAQGASSFDHNRELQHIADLLSQLQPLYARSQLPGLWSPCTPAAAAEHAAAVADPEPGAAASGSPAPAAPGQEEAAAPPAAPAAAAAAFGAAAEAEVTVTALSGSEPWAAQAAAAARGCCTSDQNRQQQQQQQQQQQEEEGQGRSKRSRRQLTSCTGSSWGRAGEQAREQPDAAASAQQRGGPPEEGPLQAQQPGGQAQQGRQGGGPQAGQELQQEAEARLQGLAKQAVEGCLISCIGCLPVCLCRSGVMATLLLLLESPGASVAVRQAVVAHMHRMSSMDHNMGNHQYKLNANGGAAVRVLALLVAQDPLGPCADLAIETIRVVLSDMPKVGFADTVQVGGGAGGGPAASLAAAAAPAATCNGAACSGAASLWLLLPPAGLRPAMGRCSCAAANSSPPSRPRPAPHPCRRRKSWARCAGRWPRSPTTCASSSC